MIRVYVAGALDKRLEGHIERIPECGCWIWMGAVNRFGYGQIRINKKLLATHRISWELKKGTIPERMNVLHRCDTPACCNPHHLFLGTMKDNTQDMLKKKRDGHGVMCGEDNVT